MSQKEETVYLTAGHWSSRGKALSGEDRGAHFFISSLLSPALSFMAVLPFWIPKRDPLLPTHTICLGYGRDCVSLESQIREFRAEKQFELMGAR